VLQLGEDLPVIDSRARARRTYFAASAGRLIACHTSRVIVDLYLLAEFEEWRPLLHDLGSCEVKHGMQVAIVSHGPTTWGTLNSKNFKLKKQHARVRWAEVAAALLLLASIAALPTSFPRNQPDRHQLFRKKHCRASI
jgi:hypothetical protein